MATNKLTDRAIQAAKPQEAEYELVDGKGLTLRVRSNGTKLWFIRYMSPTSRKRVREYLGSYPDIRLATAREMLAVRRVLLARSVDPARAAVLSSSKDEEGAPSNVGQLFSIWYRRHVEDVRKSASDRASVQSRYNKYIQRNIGDIPLSAVRRGHVMRCIDDVREAGKMRTANLVLSNLRQMMRYAVAREWLPGDPTAAITKKEAGGTDRERDRILADDELKQLRDILGRPPKSASKYYVARRRILPIHTELAVWWTLATMARAIEVASMKKLSVNRVSKTWTIPAEVSKNGEAHEVQLSDFTLAVWDCLEPLAGKLWVFDGRNGGHLSEKEVTRRLTDRQTRKTPVNGRKNSTDLDLPGGRWSQHDLRRTGATIMGEMGIPAEVIDRCLNHREQNKVTRTYQRQKMLPQRRAAFDALGAHLTEILGNPAQWLPRA
ncbi:MAG: integrase arm-type DNA-binding domain-containing protein [Burkholderiaceae bacterium]|nr:integrase arm-type DNA-binding domain-containing protein [Burkholderiaceae bacterium]